MRLTPVGKLAILIIVAGVAFGGWRLWQRFGSSIVPEAQGGKSVQPGKADLPEFAGTSGGGSASVTLPGTDVGCADKPERRMLGYAWNSQLDILIVTGVPHET